MGFPMIQVFMIAARQMSKPIAERIMHYGKEHPGFRNRVLIPTGRALARLTTRLRMTNLGLGKPTTLAPVSEAAALEQASEFVQQTVIFMYSLGVFAGYYFYTATTTPSTVKLHEFEEFKAEKEEALQKIVERLERIELLLANQNAPKVTKSSPVSKSSVTVVPTAGSSGLPRVSSLPVDEAARIVLSDDEQFIVCRAGDAVSIEPLSVVKLRTQPFVFRRQPEPPPPHPLVGLAQSLCKLILG